MRPVSAIGYWLFIILALGLVSCPDPSPPPPDASSACASSFVGDPNATPLIELLALDQSSVSVPITNGATVDIITPPQGGRVIFAGVKATNLNPCGVKVAGAIRDPVMQQVRVDTRTTNLKPQDDGWATSIDSDIATFSNIPVCPNQWSSRDIFDQDYELEVIVTDRDGRMATQKITIRPVCEELDPKLVDECFCICKQGYILGEQCP